LYHTMGGIFRSIMIIMVFGLALRSRTTGTVPSYRAFQTPVDRRSRLSYYIMIPSIFGVEDPTSCLLTLNVTFLFLFIHPLLKPIPTVRVQPGPVSSSSSPFPSS